MPPSTGSPPLSPSPRLLGENVVLDYTRDSPMFRQQTEGFNDSLKGLKVCDSGRGRCHHAACTPLLATRLKFIPPPNRITLPR
jgi:hypothetical protein